MDTQKYNFHFKTFFLSSPTVRRAHCLPSLTGRYLPSQLRRRPRAALAALSCVASRSVCFPTCTASDSRHRAQSHADLRARLPPSVIANRHFVRSFRDASRPSSSNQESRHCHALDFARAPARETERAS